LLFFLVRTLGGQQLSASPRGGIGRDVLIELRWMLHERNHRWRCVIQDSGEGAEWAELWDEGVVGGGAGKINTKNADRMKIYIFN
jgi:hypothetical protein